ncbi:Protein bricabrac 2like, partial [Caligus rogercresseyi]
MTAALEPCSSSTTDWIINMFEAEQKSAVFGSLAGYLNTATFADVSLACRNQVLRAHKVVLAASSKFFSDLFRHNP